MAIDRTGTPRARIEYGRIHIETEEFILEWVKGAESGVQSEKLGAWLDLHR